METPKALLKFYGKSWGFEPGNASAGFELGRRSLGGMSDWSAIDKWKPLSDLISFTIRVWDVSVMFHFRHPGEFRFYVLQIHPTRG